MELSSPKKVTNVTPLVTTEEVTGAVSENIVDLSAKRTGRIANRSAAAAKRWKSGHNAPDAASLINLAIGHERTRRWLLWKIVGDWSRVMDPHVMTELHAFLWRAADAGDLSARALLQRIHQAPASLGAIPSQMQLAGDGHNVSGHFAGAGAP